MLNFREYWVTHEWREIMYAPIVIFVYNRADRVERLVNSLAANAEARESELYFFSDGPKNEDGIKKVDDVRKYIDSVPTMNVFKSVHITKSEKNKGLANSIIDGVTLVMKKHGRAIIIEDDNVVAPDFLDYMNRGLEYYQADKQIWAISGYARKMDFPADYTHDIFIMQRISSYTWASWGDRWNKTEWNIEKLYPDFLWNRKKRVQFDNCGEDRSIMLDAQVCGKVNSWAIRFEYSMVQNDMYSVIPCISRSFCTGNDGSGTHSNKVVHTFDAVVSDGKKKVVFERLKQREDIRKEFIKPYRRSPLRRVIGNVDYIIRFYKGKNKR